MFVQVEDVMLHDIVCVVLMRSNELHLCRGGWQGPAGVLAG